jgi:hypothetical protein
MAKNTTNTRIQSGRMRPTARRGAIVVCSTTHNTAIAMNTGHFIATCLLHVPGRVSPRRAAPRAD